MSKILDQINNDNWDILWNNYSASASQNPAQTYRHRLILKLIRQLKPNADGLRVIDFGSGQGDFLKEMHNEFPDAKLIGFEKSELGVKISRVKVSGAKFIESDLLVSANLVENLQGWGNIAVCSEVLEHVDHPVKLLRNILPYINGFLIVTVPGGPMSAFDRKIGHRKHYNRQEISTVLTKAGFYKPEVFASGFPFFNLYRLAIIARGKRLIDDAKKINEKKGSVLYSFFDFLFKFNTMSSIFGWQMVAYARSFRK